MFTVDDFRKILCLPVFTGVFLYFLGQWVRVNSRKCLFPSIHRSVNGWKIAQISTFASRFLAFRGTVYSGVFQCPLTGIVRSLPPTIAQPAGYQYSVDLKAYFLSQSEKQTQMALLILKMIYLKLYSAVSFLQTYNYSSKIRGQFSTLKNKIITINSLARKFFHLTPLKKNYLQDLFDKITNP